ncbi:MAG TPA: hypothetical protein PK140_13865, partial [Polyangiaceae bacterium]|nr:hypothetical protein [Polyangiaceae bacterium]HQF22847.1 hypothetical protein [Polyangiaceae bacterium]HQM10482.1 hypothetical protein [Polyangiaceae bacterium]
MTALMTTCRWQRAAYAAMLPICPCHTPTIQFDGNITGHMGCSECRLGGWEDGRNVYRATTR